MRLKLTTKFAIITGIVLLVAMSLFAFFNISSLEDLYLQEAIKDADNLGETIIRTTHYQMLEDNRERVYKMIEEVSEQKGVENIRLFNKDGIINFSTEKAEIGTAVRNNSEGCNGCHTEGSPLIDVPTSARSRIFTNSEGEKILGVTKEINNKESCYTADCHFHSKEVSLLGVLDVHVSLEEMQTQISSSRNDVVVFTFTMLIALSSCLAFLTQKLVNQPVNELLQHTRKLARGELTSRIGAPRKDELGELAEAFNDMTANLQAAQGELKDWGTTLEAKVEERTREIKEMQTKLVQSAKLASVGELVAGIAHEINNPLTGILMFSSMIKKDPGLSPPLQEDLDIVIGETQRCAGIVKGLLDFSRESAPMKKPTSVHMIMDRTLNLVKHQAAFHNIQIVKEYHTELPVIMADPNQLEQVFMNIILNAGQAMEGRGILSLATDIDEGGKELSISIGDSGCGIPEEALPKIFDPFFTTKDARGTGLGLSVSYGIIENHGGQIEVASTPGKGTTFTIALPVEAGGAEA